MAYAPVQETLAPLVAPPDDIERRYRLAQALLAESMGGEPVGHWTQGVNKLLQALVGGMQVRGLKKEDAAGEAAAWQAIADFDFGGGDYGGGGYEGGAGGETADVPGAEAVSSAPTSDVEAYIRQSASARGIDPNVAVRVAKSEGLAPGVWQSNVRQGGKRETSYGPFQLLVGGGLGDKFIRQTGLDPRDPSTVKQQIDFALDQARQGGWSPWYGAAKVGVGNWTGIGRGRAAAPADETADIPGAEPVGSAPSPDVMGFLGGGAQPAGVRLSPHAEQPPPLPRPRPVYGATPPQQPVAGQAAEQAALRPPPIAPVPQPSPVAAMGAPPPPIVMPPAATPPQHPLARVPQPRPAPPAAPAAPATTGTVAAPAPARPVYTPPFKNDYNAVPGRPQAAMPMKPGQLMQEPYSGPMSAEDFARQAQIAMRAKGAGQAPVTGQPQQPRRNLLQALLGRGGPQGQAGAPAAPVASAAPAGGPAAPMDPRRAQIASLLSNPRVPDALKLMALKSLTPQARDPFTLGPGQVRYGPDGQPIAAVPATPEKRDKAVDANGVPRWVDTGEPVFPGDTTGGKAPPKITDVAAMRKELHGLDTYKRYAKAAPVFNSLSESFGKNTRAGDLDFIYAMATIFDPESVVREGEQILVRNTANLPDQVVNGISSLMSGTGQLDAETRRNLYDVVHGRMKQYREAADTELAGFPEMAGRWGIDPADIMPNLMELKTLPGTEPATAAAGSSRDNPARPASDADIDALPSGTYYVAPDGSVRRKR